MDLSKLSTEDLLALKAGDLSKVSTEGLKTMRTAQVAQQIENDPISKGAKNFTQDMGFFDKFNAGTGKAMTDLARGLQQRMGMRSREQVKEDRALDAPLMNTGAGMAGNVMGNVTMLAPASLASGGTIPAAATIGAITGYLQPSESLGEDLRNTGFGAAGGAAGQWAANKAAGSVAFQQAEANKTVAKNAQKTATAKNAAAEGYVIPPEDLGQGGGALSRAASGFAGKIKTAQEASFRNQGVTDKLARQAIGLKEGDELTADVLQSIRQQAAAKGYDPIKQAGTVTSDPAFFKALDDIAATQQGAAKSFPGLGENGVVDLIAKLKQPAFDASDAIDATKILRAQADKAYRQGDATLGKANKAAADAIEGMLERHLSAAGQTDALQMFKEARTLMAKTYSVQKSLNNQTGQVAAEKLAKELAKGKPLTDELRTVAETASAFPKATQSLKEAPKALSPLDMAVAFGGGNINPMMLAWLGRPVVRNALLSQPMQRSAINAAETPQTANALLRVLEAENLTMPVGVTAGTGLSRYLVNQ